MTAEQIKSMQAGLEIDLAIARCFPDLTTWCAVARHGPNHVSYAEEDFDTFEECATYCEPLELVDGTRFTPEPSERFSEDIGAAWKVVEWLRNGNAKLLHFQLKTEDDEWMAAFGEIDPTSFENMDCWMFGNTAPLAIGRAALLAVQEDKA